METMTSQQVDTVDCAKLIRRDLQQHFPGIKFSVRSSRYSGGSSVRVKWLDGPTAKQVEAIAQRREGATFDGMQDLKEYHDDMVLTTDGQMVAVHYGADFVFCNRDYSNYDGMRDTLARRVWASYGPLADRPFNLLSWPQERIGGDWMDSFVGRILARTDLRTQSVTTVEIWQ